MPEFDQRDFRSALGRFATGVTIITARGSDGRPAGVTANSFNSVSLDPPLVLWSLGRTSNSREIFESADEFAIHVLGIGQEDLSNRFATRGADKFGDLDIGEEGVPLLEGCAARFHCRKVQAHDVGDHILFIGEVVRFDTCEGAPLLYHQGGYGEARRREAAELAYDLEAARLGKGAILNLFSYAYVQIMARVRAEFERLDLRQPAPTVLTALSEGLTRLEDIEHFVAERDYSFSAPEREALVRQGFVAVEAGRLRLLPAGREIYGKMLVALEEIEGDLTAEFTAGELSEARHFLARIGNFESASPT